jgi:hypothetical protein
VAEKRYDAALADFQKARELDPGDADGISTSAPSSC